MTIKSSDVVFRYGNNEVLSGLTFSVPEGEVTYLAGENGSGKTTWILNAVNLLRLKDGKILYDGKSFDEVRTRISVSFDTTPLYLYLSVEENLKVLFHIDAEDTENHNFLNRMCLTDALLRTRAKKLSYGQKHRIGIGGALLRDADSYILDEPDLGLDPVAWEVVKDRIENLKNKGKAVLITGQNYPMLQEFVTRIVVLKEGKAIYEGSCADFLGKFGPNEGSLRKAFEISIGKERTHVE